MMLVSVCLFFVISRAYSVESIRLVVQPDDAINEPGKPSLFKCIFDDEPAQCLWMKDGRSIADDATTYRLVGQKHFYDCSLQVSLPETSVNHTFQCVSPETPGVKSVRSRVATLFAADAVADRPSNPLPLVQDLVLDNHFHQSSPILLVHPIDQTVLANGTATLRCEFDREPPGCVWLRDDNPLYFQSDDRYTVANKTSGDCSLRIENVTADAEGSYRCESPQTSALTSARSDAARLTVTSPPTSVSIIHDGLDYSNGEIRPQKDLVNVTCLVKGGHPKPNMSWKFRNETILAEVDEVRESGLPFPDSYVASLSIATGSDMRESLECAVDHPALEERIEVSVRIVVVQEQRLPVVERNGTVLRHGETVLIPEGEWMYLKCVSPGSQCRTVNLSWSLGDLDNSTVLTNYSCVPSNSKDGRGDAIGELSAVPVNDVDLYCRAKHAHLGYLLEAKVAVKVFSPLTTVLVRFDSRDGEELAAMVNSTVNLTCDADGNLPTRYRWFFKLDGQEEWEEFSGERKVAVLATEKGNYSCRANNGYDPKWFASSNEVHLRLKEAVTLVEASFAEFTDRQVSIPKDGEVSAVCVTDGDPPVTFLWYGRLNDSAPWSLMNTSHGNNVTNMHTVSIVSDGWYKCAAHNEASLGVQVDSEELFVTVSSQERRRSSSSVAASSAVLVFLMSCLTMSTAS